jgi:hypothetical protein
MLRRQYSRGEPEPVSGQDRRGRSGFRRISPTKSCGFNRSFERFRHSRARVAANRAIPAVAARCQRAGVGRGATVRAVLPRRANDRSQLRRAAGPDAQLQRPCAGQPRLRAPQEPLSESAPGRPRDWKMKASPIAGWLKPCFRRTNGPTLARCVRSVSRGATRSCWRRRRATTRKCWLPAHPPRRCGSRTLPRSARRRTRPTVGCTSPRRTSPRTFIARSRPP